MQGKRIWECRHRLTPSGTRARFPARSCCRLVRPAFSHGGLGKLSRSTKNSVTELMTVTIFAPFTFSANLGQIEDNLFLISTNHLTGQAFNRKSASVLESSKQTRLLSSRICIRVIPKRCISARTSKSNQLGVVFGGARPHNIPRTRFYIGSQSARPALFAGRNK